MNNISFNGHSKIEYQYGSYIPISDIVYERLLKLGYKPKIIVGWAEVWEEIYEGEILPDKKFIKLFKNRGAFTFQHTWVECKHHRIDLTKCQFKDYGGIYSYYPAYVDIPSKDKQGQELHTIVKYRKKVKG